MADFPSLLFKRYGAAQVEFLKSNSGDGIRLRFAPGTDLVKEAQNAVCFFQTLPSGA